MRLAVTRVRNVGKPAAPTSRPVSDVEVRPKEKDSINFSETPVVRNGYISSLQKPLNEDVHEHEEQTGSDAAKDIAPSRLPEVHGLEYRPGAVLFSARVSLGCSIGGYE